MQNGGLGYLLQISGNAGHGTRLLSVRTLNQERVPKV
jgi:hypothetical protein